jgi:HlyD family secretion protein
MMLATTLIARRPSSQIRGLAWAEPVVLAAPSDGTLAEVEVTLHQSVAVGELIGFFDPEALTARRRVLLAEIEALTQAQITDRQGRTRLFERDREQAGLELGELTARAREGQARIDALYERLAIDARLFAEGVAPQERVLAVRREIKVVETRLAADRERLHLARLSANRASSRAATAPGPNEWQIEAARRELDQIEKRIQRLALRSTISGQVTEIYRRPGEWLQAGERVLRISPAAATEVHAWLDSRAAPRLRSGVAAQIRNGSGQRLSGSVKSVGAERLQMPRSLWARSDTPEWGYLMRIEVADGTLAPGEPVQVGLRPARPRGRMTSVDSFTG